MLLLRPFRSYSKVGVLFSIKKIKIKKIINNKKKISLYCPTFRGNRINFADYIHHNKGKTEEFEEYENDANEKINNKDTITNISQ